MIAVRSLPLIALVTLVGACGSNAESTTTPPPVVNDGTTDVRAAIPAADPAYIDFVTPDIVVPAGKEQMHCIHFAYNGEDVAFSDVESLQGKFGHHAVLLGAKAPQAEKTVEDCSKSEDMQKYDPYAIPVELPAAHGVFLPKGKKMVLQTHYVNTTRNPIKIRDIVRLKKRPISEVTTWTSVFATNSVALKLPPKQKTTFSFDCAVPMDAKLLILGGHMHEYGSKIEISYGMDPMALKQLYTADWQVEYRDAPPITMMMTNPMGLAKGATLRTSCTWDNTTDHQLGFPEEMCSAFGYVAGVKEALVCRHGE